MAKTAKGVSWAPGLKLCQVRLFMSEDAPVLSSSDSQDHLQAKTTRLWHSSMSGCDELLPPGFESFTATNYFKINVSQIPLIQWKHPVQFDLNPNWLWAAGGESVEVHFQNRRQLGVLEAIYPRPSSIPPNPSVSPEALESHQDDACIPLVPIIGVEEEGPEPANSIPPNDASITQNLTGHMAIPTKCETQQPQGNSVAPQQSSTEAQAATPIHGVEADVAAAATLAFRAIMSSGGKGSLADREYLFKILSDTKLVDKWTSELPDAPSLLPAPLPGAYPSPHTHFSASPPISQPGGYHPPNFNTTNLFYPLTAQAPPMKDPNGMRDMNYYKSLVEQHGGEKRGTWDPSPSPQFSNRFGDDDGDKAMQGLKQRDLKVRVAKPCVYFNTPRGCKHGANCLFQHDASLPPPVERRNPKRVKLDNNEITGRN